MDDVRRLISDTSVYLLAITILASALHLLFEFLAFQSDISFWNNNRSLAGLSTRALVTDLFSQIVVYILDILYILCYTYYTILYYNSYKAHRRA